MKQNHESAHTAYHEAPHAVIALFYNFPVSGVSIELDEAGNRHGYTCFDHNLPTRDDYLDKPENERQKCFPEVFALCSVLVAGGISTNVMGRTWGSGGNEDDIACCLKIIDSFFLEGTDNPDTQLRFLDKIKGQTRDLLEDDDINKAIEYLASDLVEHGNLFGESWQKREAVISQILPDIESLRLT